MSHKFTSPVHSFPLSSKIAYAVECLIFSFCFTGTSALLSENQLSPSPFLTSAHTYPSIQRYILLGSTSNSSPCPHGSHTCYHPSSARPCLTWSTAVTSGAPPATTPVCPLRPLCARSQRRISLEAAGAHRCPAGNASVPRAGCPSPTALLAGPVPTPTLLSGISCTWNDRGFITWC